MPPIVYLTSQQVIEINKTVLQEIRVKKADSHGVQNRAAIGEIVERVTTKGDSIHEKTAILLIELTQRHPFASGVRRTAYVAAKLFLEANGEKVHVKYEPKVMQGIRERFYNRSEVVNWLNGHEFGNSNVPDSEFRELLERIIREDRSFLESIGRL